MEPHYAKRKAGLLTLENVAEYLHVHRSTIYRMIRRNQLPAFKFGAEWRFNPESIERWRADGEQKVHGAGGIPRSNNGAGARVSLAHNASPLGARPAKQPESTSQPGRLLWTGWPRLTDP